MAVVRSHGKPSFFLTITANPKWPEIVAELGPWETVDSGNLPFALTLHSYTGEVQPSTFYRLRLTDIYGDGFCCGYGVGWSTVTTAMTSRDYMNGTVIWQSSGSFQSQLDAYFWVSEVGDVQHVEYRT